MIPQVQIQLALPALANTQYLPSQVDLALVGGVCDVARLAGLSAANVKVASLISYNYSTSPPTQKEQAPTPGSLATGVTDAICAQLALLTSGLRRLGASAGAHTDSAVAAAAAAAVFSADQEQEQEQAQTQRAAPSSLRHGTRALAASSSAIIGPAFAARFAIFTSDANSAFAQGANTLAIAVSRVTTAAAASSSAFGLTIKVWSAVNNVTTSSWGNVNVVAITGTTIYNAAAAPQGNGTGAAFGSTAGSGLGVGGNTADAGIIGGVIGGILGLAIIAAIVIAIIAVHRNRRAAEAERIAAVHAPPMAEGAVAFPSPYPPRNAAPGGASQRALPVSASASARDLSGAVDEGFDVSIAVATAALPPQAPTKPAALRVTAPGPATLAAQQEDTQAGSGVTAPTSPGGTRTRAVDAVSASASLAQSQSQPQRVSIRRVDSPRATRRSGLATAPVITADGPPSPRSGTRSRRGTDSAPGSPKFAKQTQAQAQAQAEVQSSAASPKAAALQSDRPGFSGFQVVRPSTATASASASASAPATATATATAASADSAATATATERFFPSLP